MQLRQYTRVFLTTSLLLGLTGRSCFAISLGGATNPTSLEYFVDDGRGVVMTNKVVLLDPPKENSPFMKLLKDVFNDGWKFKLAVPNSLDGLFSVEQNIPAIGEAPDPYLGFPRVEAIGAKFNLIYLQPLPESNEPSSPQPNKLYWIQRVSDFDFPGKKGNPNNFIDVPSNQNNPFYELQFNPPLEARNFIDEPTIRRVTQNNTFSAELYLAELSDPNNPTKPQEVTIHQGVSWGWKNTFARPPQPSKTFTDSLSSGYEIDKFTLNGCLPSVLLSSIRGVIVEGKYGRLQNFLLFC